MWVWLWLDGYYVDIMDIGYPYWIGYYDDTFPSCCGSNCPDGLMPSVSSLCKAIAAASVTKISRKTKERRISAALVTCLLTLLLFFKLDIHTTRLHPWNQIKSLFTTREFLTGYKNETKLKIPKIKVDKVDVPSSVPTAPADRSVLAAVGGAHR